MLIYYGAGALLAYTTYALTNTPGYGHGSGGYSTLLYLLWLGGAIWGLFSLKRVFERRDTHYFMGAALVSAVVTLGTLIWVNQSSQQATEAADTQAHEDYITTEISKDTVIVRNHGVIIFYRIGDSVYLDELSKFYPPDSILKKQQ